MEGRVEIINESKGGKNVLYLMSRDLRIFNNHAVNLCYELSFATKTQFFIGFDPSSLKMNERQNQFVLEGFKELEKDAKRLNLPVFIIHSLSSFVKEFSIDRIILDFSALREALKIKEEIRKFCKEAGITLMVCDSHNIVPCRELKVYKRTGKSVRMQLNARLEKYLKKIEKVEKHSFNSEIKLDGTFKRSNFETLSDYLKTNYDPIKSSEKSVFVGGYRNGMKMMEDFFSDRIENFVKDRNDPDRSVNSNLSPWLHTGQISAQEVVRSAKKHLKNDENLESFLNEIFIWRETAEHFIFHEPNYDNIDGALPWAKETLLKHTEDKRKVIYSFEEFEEANTKDPLWNAGQNELLKKGKMHGYVRMYWAKKILEWTKTPQEAIKIAIHLNDKYSLDGNDPNGYLGIMWSICGSIDRAFKEREIFGKIRYMKSFKSENYVSKNKK